MDLFEAWICLNSLAYSVLVSVFDSKLNRILIVFRSVVYDLQRTGAAANNRRTISFWSWVLTRLMAEAVIVYLQRCE